MAPPVESFPVSELAARVQRSTKARQGKQHKGAEVVDLKKCELLEMVQYSCQLAPSDEAVASSSKIIRCKPVVKLFRRLEFFFFRVLCWLDFSLVIFLLMGWVDVGRI